MSFFTARELAQAAGKQVIRRSPPCRYCGGKDFIVENGSGPHARRLRCAECNRSAGWLPKAVAAKLERRR
jgi:hypothetical protein